MRTRNSNFLNNSNVTILRRQNRGCAPNVVEPELRTIVAPMAERTMEELLRAPTEGYGEAIVLPKINVDHFEIKTNLLQLVQANPFHGLENENPHAHINSFKRITSTLRFRNVPNDVIKLMMFPYSLEGAAKTWESVSKTDERIDKLADQLSTLVEIVSKKVFTPAPVKAVEETLCYLWWCTIIGSTAHIPPPVNPIPIPEPDVPKTLPKPNIPYPSRRNDQKFREKASYQKEKIFQMFQDLRFDISFADALFFMPRFAPTIKNLLMNKEKLLELAKISFVRELDRTMSSKRFLLKLRDPGKFLIPCNFPGMDYAPELLGFSNKSSGGNPTLTSEPFTSEFILEEIEACLKDDSISPEIDHADCDPKGDICLIEKLLNNDPLQLPPMDLNQGEIIKAKPSIEEPPELELKDLPSYLEYAYFG
ncbi:hypothetical protein Tco_1427850 [Tanacetum coccineum]